MWNRDMFSLYPSYYWLRKWRGWGLFKSSACLILWPMVDNFFHFRDQAAGMLHIQMNYKYKRMIFFFLILEIVTFATSPPIKCVWNNPRGVNRFVVNFNISIGKTVWMQRFMQRINNWLVLLTRSLIKEMLAVAKCHLMCEMKQKWMQGWQYTTWLVSAGYSAWHFFADDVF